MLLLTTFFLILNLIILPTSCNQSGLFIIKGFQSSFGFNQKWNRNVMSLIFTFILWCLNIFLRYWHQNFSSYIRRWGSWVSEHCTWYLWSSQIQVNFQLLSSFSNTFIYNRMNEKSVYVQRGGTRFLFLGDNANWNFGAVLGEDTGYFWKVSFYLHFYFISS